MKVVLDTNVLIAAFAARGLCEAVVELCLQNHEIIVSAPLLLEVEEKLKSKLGLPEGIAADIIEFLRSQAMVVEPNAVSADACRDPNDLMVLGTAEAATCIVTGDEDLLTLETFGDILILTPRKFWESESSGGRREI